MVGLVGGTVDDARLSEMRSYIHSESWYESDAIAGGGCAAVMLHHGDRDPRGASVHEGPEASGLLFGTIPGLDDFGEFVRSVADAPEEALAGAEGSFLLVWTSRHRDEIFLATDKLSSRIAFYTDVADEPAFASNVAPLARLLDSPSVNAEAAAQLISRDFIFGDGTLVKGVRRISPATVARFGSDGVETTRYWTPPYDDSPKETYAADAVAAYERYLTRIDDTIPGEAGIYLTGGLDSRVLAGLLSRVRPQFSTYTFDYNPTRTNLKPASRLASAIGVPNEAVDFSAAEFVEIIETGVSLTSGLVHWRNYFTFPFVFNRLPETGETLVLNLAQGELFGDFVRREELDGRAAAALLGKQKRSPSPVLADNVDVDIDAPLYAEIERRQGMRESEIVRDVLLFDFYPNYHYSKLAAIRSQGPTRFALAGNELLTHVAHLPADGRKQRARPPFDAIEHVNAPMKLRLAREVDDGVERIRSANTQLPPTYPQWLHTLTYKLWTNIPIASLRKPHLGFLRKPHNFRSWYEHEPVFRNFVDAKLASAADRDLFSATKLDRILDEQRNNPFRSHVEYISWVTTIETLIQQLNLDT